MAQEKELNIKGIKRCLKILNKSYPGQFKALIQLKPKKTGVWYIICNNQMTYFDDEFRRKKKALRKILKDDGSLVFVHLPDVDLLIKQRSKEGMKYLKIKS